MVNHPSRAKRYRVWAIPGASDEAGITHFEVKGPDVNEFARMETLAKIMEHALNSRTLKTDDDNKMVGG